MTPAPASPLQPPQGTQGVGRFAPSPTGDLHIGNLRTAAAAWAWARVLDNRFLIRVDDLDPDRSRPQFEASQLGDLTRLGMTWDSAPIRQSDRAHIYRQTIEQLRQMDLVYPCFCTRAEIRAAASAPHDASSDDHYPGTCGRLTGTEQERRIAQGTPFALRVRADKGVPHYRFHDLVLGEVSGPVDDFIIARKDNVAAYNLATVVDDAESQVTLVVRGADLAATTCRQLWLADALGVRAPSYAHVPLVVGKGGLRLSKRDGSVTMNDLLGEGSSVSDVQEWIMTSLGASPTGSGRAFADPNSWFAPDRIPRAPVTWHGI